MPPMVDTRDWCDVDSDEGFCIPELPPLPEMVQCQVRTETSSSVTKTEPSPRSVTPANPQRFRFDFTKEYSPKTKSAKSTGYICFVGKFPNHTSIADLKNFVKSKGIIFTGIRMGPKKRPNVNTFGYVDLPTRKDYEMLLSLDGTFYRGRAIRVDHATRKETPSRGSRMKRVPTRNNAPVSTPYLQQRKSYKLQEVLKKTAVQPRKTRGRFSRYKTQRSPKTGTGTKRKQKYRKVQKNSPPNNSTRYRLEELPRKFKSSQQ